MQKDILFDNIYIGHSAAEADKLKEGTYDIKRPIEEKEESIATPAPSKEEESAPGSFKEDPVAYVKSKVALFVAIAQINPVEAAKTVPEVAAGAVVLIISVMALAGTLLGSPDAAVKAKDAKAKAKEGTDKLKEKSKEVKDAAADAAATGADKAADATKRTTRSSKADE
jgi:calnexin